MMRASTLALITTILALYGQMNLTYGNMLDLDVPPNQYFKSRPHVEENVHPHRPHTPFRQQPQPQCPKGFIKAGERCLWINQTPLPWNPAQTFCNQYGLRLLEVRSGNYYVEVVKALRKAYGGRGSFWVGASRKQGPWSWNSKYTNIPEPFWAISFNNGKPVKEPQDDTKHCAFLDDERWYFLNADNCASYKQFICEKVPTEKTHRAGGSLYFEGEDSSESSGEHAGESEDEVASEARHHFEEFNLRCPPGWTHNGTNCYNAFNTKLSYLAAKQACANQSSHLTSIHSQVENNFVTTLTLHSGFLLPNDTVWIGLHKLGQQTFRWDDGTPYDFTQNWLPGEPDNAFNSEDCAFLDPHKNGKWGDDFCGSANGFICKKPELDSRSVYGK